MRKNVLEDEMHERALLNQMREEGHGETNAWIGLRFQMREKVLYDEILEKELECK